MAKESGLTLIELLVTIVVLRVLLALGVPGLQNFVKSNRATGQANDLAVAIQLARSEAVKRGTRGVICAKETDKELCSGNDDWTTGWIVFTDIDQDGTLKLDVNGDGVEDCVNDDCIVRTHGAVKKATLDGAGVDSISFLPNGLVHNAPDVDMTLTLTADNCEKDQSRAISITKRGHTRVTRQDCP